MVGDEFVGSVRWRGALTGGNGGMCRNQAGRSLAVISWRR